MKTIQLKTPQLRSKVRTAAHRKVVNKGHQLTQSQLFSDAFGEAYKEFSMMMRR
ncbi:MAG: hypothetical protein WBG71_12415 [Leeuwenhoekiella sp.]